MVWVTGASRGLGRVMAHAFAAAGADLLLSARSADTLGEVAREVGHAGAEVEAVAGSVGDAGAIERAVATAADRWGRLDALVNNAGISNRFEAAEKVSLKSLREMLETNLLAPFEISRRALPLLEAGEGGSVVNVSSIHGTLAHERMLGYSISKGGLEMLTRTLAVEWAERGVRVNSLAPGYVETDLSSDLIAHPRWGARILERTPMGRLGTAEEIAACAVFLASPASSYVTGTTLFADGGWTAR